MTWTIPPGYPHAGETFPPAVLSIPDVAAAWNTADGSQSALVAAVAVCCSESSFDAHAISIDDAIGLWQILYSHASDAGQDTISLMDPATNARYAVELSNNGADWSAWDSAYDNAHPATEGRHAIPYPEHGSNAYACIPDVQAALAAAPTGITGGGAPGVPVQPAPPGTTYPQTPNPATQQPSQGQTAVENAWNTLNSFGNQNAPAVFNFLVSVRDGFNQLQGIS